MEPTTRVDASAERLRERLGEPVILPSDARYEEARKLWNGAADKRPAAIVKVRGTEDVAEAIRWARDAGVEIAVRGGGHSMGGQSMSDGGLTIDLSQLNSVEIDPEAKRAVVGGGALLDDVGTAAEPHSLAFPYGHVSHTGVGGFTLGGGLGWASRSWGLAIDCMVGATVVSAEGEVVYASEDENDDLFWGLRGGGGNFGVVTEFEFGLFDHGPVVLAGLMLYPMEGAAEALRFSRDFMETAPRELTVYETFLSVPPDPQFPAELHGQPVLGFAALYAGDVEEGERVMAPLRAHGTPIVDAIQPMPPMVLQHMLDPGTPHGLHYYSRSHWLAEMPDAAIDALVELHARVTSPLSQVILARMGGGIEDGGGDTAFGHRDAHRLAWIVSAWPEGDGEPHVEWCREVFDALAPYASGVYVNALGDEGIGRTRAAFAPEVWSRLVAVKDRWDPENVFRLNANIPPSNGAEAAG